ncbi:MAG: LysM peptidoglycan-binding domain-containing protein [Bacteroidia bacterium]|nr:LysM peptidoglycan-binding domain-containing protein [Bacteroidia bacterium]MDW8134265.1 LysM peptidoglycan-binding domain-containing protein [Bacteroidia bacterium]
MRKQSWSILLILCHACLGQSAPSRWTTPDSIFSYCGLDTTYPFLQLKENKILFAGYLRSVWELLRLNSRKVRVLHVGDSHLQGEVQGREIRKRLYAIWGEGGRGYVFPYAIAGTTSAYDYSSIGRGQWLSARSAQWQPALPLGVTGMAIGTHESTAEWEIRWAPAYAPVASPNAKIYLLVRSLWEGIYLTLTLNDTLVLPTQSLQLGYALSSFTSPVPLYSIKGTFYWHGEDSLSYVELQGIFIEEGSQGISWHTMGVNGARLSDWATLPLLRESLRLLNPDLVVIDLGTNDLHAPNTSLVDFCRALEAAIDTVRAVLPEAAILLTTPHEFYRRMRPIPYLAQAAYLIRRIAAQKRVAVWDAYKFLGPIREWRLAGLALPDMVHLTPAGYALKGQMLGDAFLKSYGEFLRDSLPDPTVEAHAIATFSLSDTLEVKARPLPLTPSLSQFGGNSAVKYVPARPAYVYHKVRPGETLGYIAQRYRTSVKAIQYANGLKGTRIRAGQTLRIPTNVGSRIASPSLSQHSRIHIVQLGESLWSISQKYGVSIQALCEANGITLRSVIYPGQRLRIP